MAIPLIGPDGRQYVIDDPAKLKRAIELGYRESGAAPQTLGEQIGVGAEDVANVIQTGTEGAAQGFAPGMLGSYTGAPKREGESSAEFKVRSFDAKEMKRRKEESPIVSGVGEFTGMALSPLNKIAAGVTGAMGATTALGRIGAEAVGQGSIGLLYGAGNTLSDSALGDHDLTAEKMIAGTGLGGILGLAGGAAGAGLGEAVGAAIPKIRGLLGGAKDPLNEFAEHRWLKAGGAIQSDIKKIPEADRPAVANVIREAMTPTGKVMPATLEEAARAVAAERDAVAKQLLTHVGVGDAGGLSPAMNQEDALAAIAKGLDENGAKVGAVLKKADAMGALPSYSGALKRFDDFEAGLNLAERDIIAGDLQKVRGYLQKMGEAPVDSADNSFSALNSIKSTIQKDTNFVADGGAKYGLKRQIAGILRDEIDTQLAPQIGSDLSKEFLDAKAAFGALSNAEKALGRKTSTGADAIRALVEGASLAETSLAGKLSALDHATNLISHGMDRKLGNRAVSPSDYATGIAAGLMRGGPLGVLSGLATSIGHKLLRERGSAVVAKLADAISKSPQLAIAAQSFGKQAQAAAPFLGKYAAPIMQAIAHSPATGLATHMTMAQADPDYADAAKAAGFLPETPEEHQHASAKASALTGMAATIDQQNTKIGNGLDQVMKGTRAPHAASKVMGSQDFGAKRMRRDASDSHDQRIKEIRELATNPEALIDRVTSNVGALGDMAPGVSAAMTRTAMAAATFLANEAKQPEKSGPLGADWVPTEAEMHGFATVLEAVQDPLSILKHAASGTLVPDQLRAVQAVYPFLARQIQDMALERLTDPPKDVPYQARFMLAMLTGTDPDGTFGSSIAMNQTAIQAASVKPSNAGAPHAGSADKLTIAARTATPSQKLEQEAPS